MFYWIIFHIAAGISIFLTHTLFWDISRIAVQFLTFTNVENFHVIWENSTRELNDIYYGSWKGLLSALRKQK